MVEKLITSASRTTLILQQPARQLQLRWAALSLAAWIAESILSQYRQLEQCEDYEELEWIARFYCHIDARSPPARPFR